MIQINTDSAVLKRTKVFAGVVHLRREGKNWNTRRNCCRRMWVSLSCWEANYKRQQRLFDALRGVRARWKHRNFLQRIQPVFRLY